MSTTSTARAAEVAAVCLNRLGLHRRPRVVRGPIREENIYHGTWDILNNRTVMLHDWDEELGLSPGNNRELTVSLNHVLTSDES